MIPDPNGTIDRLRAFQRELRQTLIIARKKTDGHTVARASAADTIYSIDAEVEPLLIEFCREWGKTTPLVLIAEGLANEDGAEVERLIFPAGLDEASAAIRLIIDPIDGTRGLMYDKRAAWTLAGVAPNRGEATRLSDIEAAVMTELPTSKMGQADALWAVRGQGATGERIDLSNGEATPLRLRPSSADGIDHGFATVANFFPGTKALASELMERIARELLGEADVTRAAVFDDQYISTGGQFYELIVGHDRFIADLRPIFYQIQRQPAGLCCHPYDCATMLVAAEAGVELTDGLGRPLEGPLDTTTGLSWAAYANCALRGRIEPIIRAFINERLKDELPLTPASARSPK